LLLFISNTFLLRDVIYFVATQICAFIFFLSGAIRLRWVLIWAGWRSLGLGESVPWHCWARAAVPQHRDRCPPGGSAARQLKYLPNVIRAA